jgi:hypothetical protein
LATNHDLLPDQVTAEGVAGLFGELIRGTVVRYELPLLKGVHFVMTEALGGGVSKSLRADPHGKTYQSLILELDVQPVTNEGVTT